MRATATMMAPVNVWARIDQQAKRVVPDTIELTLARNNEVEWYSDDESAFIIDFDGRTPFASALFQLPAGGSVCSGPPRSTAAVGPYKYKVLDSAGNLVVDPQIVIRQ